MLRTILRLLATLAILTALAAPAGAYDLSPSNPPPYQGTRAMVQD